uniref:CCHC-type domain-containing protein n=1 Tax=Trichogramma kaykai TaxID=54128 RepID=A0ABD2WK33_9HYME
MMATETNNYTPGGKLQDVVNPPASSDQVKALVAGGCPSDSGEGNNSKISEKGMNQLNLEVDPTSLQLPKTMKDRRGSISSNVSSIGSNASSLQSKKRKLEEMYEGSLGDNGLEHELIMRIEAIEKETLKQLEEKRKKSNFPKIVIEYTQGQLVQIKAAILSTVLENVRLKGRLDGLMEEAMGRSVRSQTTYRDKLMKNKPPALPAVAGKKIKLQRRHIARVSTGDASDSAEIIKAKIVRLVNPSQSKVHVKSLFKTKSGALLIETGSDADLRKLENDPKLKESGIKFDTRESRRPRMILYDVPGTYTADTLKKAIMDQNEDMVTQTNDFDPKFKFGKKGLETTHWVLEVTPAFRTSVSQTKGLYIGWQRCRIKDFRHISRCYKCQEPGHIAKYCRATIDTCGKCSEEGHATRDCTKNDRVKRCAPCARAGKPSDHYMDSKCPLYDTALKRIISSTDYGQYGKP